jgi:DNA-binding CsgD family transcriptional regulator
MVSFDERPDFGGPRVATTSGAVVVLSQSPLIADGVVGLLPRGWRDRTSVVNTVEALEPALEAPTSTVIIDTDATGAADAISRSRTRAASVIALVGGELPGLAPETLGQADAVIDRHEAGPLTLRVAIAAGHLGMRLVPRSEVPARSLTEEVAGLTLSDTARKTLALLAEGKRDAEIARELNLSESSVRKLVQRTVRLVGARTRCQAVAIVARSGALEPVAAG